MEKAVATHSSTLAWRIHGQRSLVGCSPWGLEESDTTEQLHFDFSLSCIGGGNGNGIQYSCMENCMDIGATSLSLFTFMHWRRKWQPTPVFLPGESQGRRSLVGCRLWGRTESDTTEATSLHFTGTLDSYFPSLKKKKRS